MGHIAGNRVQEMEQMFHLPQIYSFGTVDISHPVEQTKEINQLIMLAWVGMNEVEKLAQNEERDLVLEQYEIIAQASQNLVHLKDGIRSTA